MTAVTAARIPSLRTVPAPCPGCGDDDPRELRSLPGQLLSRPQRFVSGRCGRCGLRYLVDRVVDADQPRLYDADYPLHRGPGLWGIFAPLVAASLAATDRRRVAVLRRSLPDLAAPDRVLDVGCGRPSFLRRLARETGAEGHGLDLFDDAEAAGEGARRDGVTLHRGLPPRLPETVRARAPFRAATLWHALEHDPEAAETLRTLRDLLEPAGRLVVEVPDGSAGPSARWGDRWGGLHTPRHASLFEPDTLRRTVEGAGFEVVSQERRGTLPPFVPVALGAVDAAGFRFHRHPAWALFPAWALGMALTWPWLGRPEREGAGLQLLVARPRRGD
jgi:SAM-dependent methyltransferase